MYRTKEKHESFDRVSFLYRFSKLVASETSVIAKRGEFTRQSEALVGRTVRTMQGIVVCKFFAHKFKSRCTAQNGWVVRSTLRKWRICACGQSHATLRVIICLLCPLRTISANATRLRLSLLVVTKVSFPCTQKNKHRIICAYFFCGAVTET